MSEMQQIMLATSNLNYHMRLILVAIKLNKNKQVYQWRCFVRPKHKESLILLKAEKFSGSLWGFC